MNITIPLPLFLQSVLQDNHSVPIHPSLASLLKEMSKNERFPTFYIQTEDRDGLPLVTPRLWWYAAWRADSDSWELAKVRAERERHERWIFQENVQRTAKALASLTGLEGDVLRALAFRKMKQGHKKLLTDTLKVKLVTKVEEL